MKPDQAEGTRRIAWATVTTLLIPATIYAAVVLPSFTLSSALLMLLFEVVLVAVSSNMVTSVITAILAVLMANWFLVLPHHTFLISDTNDIVLLAVFILTAVGSSVVVTRTKRSRQMAERAAFEADTLRRSVQQRADQADPDAILNQVCRQFALDWVQLRDGRGTVIAGSGTPGKPDMPTVDAVFELDEDLPDDYRLLGQGPSRIGLDRRMLNSLGMAALRAWQNRYLAVEAARAEDLEAADRSRSALLASVGHDLRNPIAAISVSAATLASTDPISVDHTELVATIRESADRLDALVANLLDMSRLEAGTLIANLAPVDVEESLAQAAAQAGSAQITISVPPDIADVTADAGLLERILANLLSNAMRHSPLDVPVELSAVQVRDRVDLRVIDHGAGIPDLDPEHLFQPFQSSGDRSPSGIGLGLAIAHGFAEAMGGKLTAAATPGGGLTVTTSLPVAL